MTTQEGLLAVSLPWQSEQWLHVNKLHEQKTLPHAFLLSGLPGIGKSRFALALAHCLMCLEPKGSLACGECRQCLLNKAGTHPDLKILEPEEKGKQIKVDQVRELVSFLANTSQQGGYKIAVIFPAEQMNINSANALLKSLEEPAANTLLLLITDSPSRLLPTIRSRCQGLRFQLPSHDDALTWLSPLVPAQVDCEQLLLEAAGQPLTAIDLVEADRMDQRSQMNRDFLAMLGGTDTPLSIAEKWLVYDLPEALAWLTRTITTLITHQMANGPMDEQWRPFISGISTQRLYKLSDQVLLLNAQLQRGGNPNKQLALEQLMLETCDVFTARAAS